jgi:hypothetical protein
LVQGEHEQHHRGQHQWADPETLCLFARSRGGLSIRLVHLSLDFRSETLSGPGRAKSRRGKASQGCSRTPEMLVLSQKLISSGLIQEPCFQGGPAADSILDRRSLEIVFRHPRRQGEVEGTG